MFWQSGFWATNFWADGFWQEIAQLYSREFVRLQSPISSAITLSSSLE